MEKKFHHLVLYYTLKHLHDKKFIPQKFAFTIHLYSYAVFAASLECHIFPEKYIDCPF